MPQCSLPTDQKQARFADSGGMYLQVSPAGLKRWFLKCRVAGAEKPLAMGIYPDVSLMTARKARDAAKLQKATGTDPVQVRMLEKLKAHAPMATRSSGWPWSGTASKPPNGAKATPNALCGNWSVTCSLGSVTGP